RAADVGGYSAMVGADEPGTLARVRALRADVVEPLAAAHEGRVFKTSGDGFLAAFASAVQALPCAIAIPSMLTARTAKNNLGSVRKAARFACGVFRAPAYCPAPVGVPGQAP